MTRSFPSVSRIGGVLRGLTHSDAAAHGATSGEGDVPDWLVASMAPGRRGEAGSSVDRSFSLPPRLGVFF
ncbi:MULTISPECIES: hypothetical protein [Pseudofrankia]|uniref:hypothetical protein n=1 Tax=Pseudofrankia TaxID=2994363 RepID=UPI0012FECB15|nr:MULTISPECIES: hypothetical protein [Pseudofrankia]